MAGRQQKKQKEIGHFGVLLWQARNEVSKMRGNGQLVKGLEAEERIIALLPKSRLVTRVTPMQANHPEYDFVATIRDRSRVEVDIEIDVKAGYYSLKNTRKEILTKNSLECDADVDDWLKAKRRILLMTLGNDEEIIERFEHGVQEILNFRPEHT